jgi:NADPH:quinone reductase
MRAWTATGPPDRTGEFTDIPEPSAGPGEAVVEVEAYSVNRGEIFSLSGVYGAPAQRGWRPGQDIAGRVIQVEAGASGFTVGQRVAGHPGVADWADTPCVLADLENRQIRGNAVLTISHGSGHVSR